MYIYIYIYRESERESERERERERERQRETTKFPNAAMICGGSHLAWDISTESFHAHAGKKRVPCGYLPGFGLGSDGICLGSLEALDRFERVTPRLVQEKTPSAEVTCSSSYVCADLSCLNV